MWRSILFTLTVFLPVVSLADDGNWPRWRGPQQNGHSTDTNLPAEWSADDVNWKTELPGEGQSSPVIWGERVFLTSALNRGTERLVLCLNRADGKILWQKSVWKGEPEPSHKMNGWASATCTTDGERVYAFFGKGGLHCLTVTGELLWSKNLGSFVTPWGTAACPILVGDKLIQNCDADEGAYMVAFDKTSGKELWRTDRENKRGWSTPVLVKVNGHQELVLNGHSGTRGYDPETGEELWFCQGFKGRGSPTVTYAHNQFYVINGLTPADLYAVKPGGKGTVTQTHMAWHTRRSGGRDLPSPIVVGDYVLAISMNGILTCYHAKSGDELWKERIGGNFSASPIAYQGKAIFLSEQGESIVIEPGDQPKIVKRNRLKTPVDELFRASITPSQGQLFIRSNNTLYNIGTRKRDS